MLDAALKYLAELATKAAAPVKVDTKDPREVAYAINGEVKTYGTSIPPRQHHAGTLADLIKLANRFASAEELDGASNDTRPVVWYDRDRVVLVLDDSMYRMETATLDLGCSDVWRRLCEVSLGKLKFEQKAFVRLLRVELAGTLDPVVLLNAVRKVKFGTDAVTTGLVQRQRESMGREINSRVETDGAELPEEVTLSVPVYKTEGERARYPVRCSVEVDPAEGTFRLLPLPDELERVYNLALDNLEERLASGLNEVPYYRGKP